MSHRIRRGLFPGGNQYSKRIQEFSGNLVAHWPLNELSGTVAYDKSIGQNNGTITTTTLGQKGIGDGLTSQYFDGTNDYIDISAIASNLISNGGFETAGGGGADVWGSWTETVSDGALANEAVTIHTGADAAKLTAGASVDTKFYQAASLVDGATYRLRFWARGDGTHEGRVTIYANDVGYIANLVATGVTAAAYSMVDMNFTVPAGSGTIAFHLYCPDTDTGVCYFDTVSVRRTDIPAFDPHEGSIVVWAKNPDWTRAANGYLFTISSDTQNRIRAWVASGGNTLTFAYEANDVAESHSKTSYSPAGFFPLGITWSLSGDEVFYYLDGDQIGTDTALGVFAGVSSIAFLGAETSVPNNPYKGNLAHGQFYNTPHSADVMAYLMRLP